MPLDRYFPFILVKCEGNCGHLTKHLKDNPVHCLSDNHIVDKYVDIIITTVSVISSASGARQCRHNDLFSVLNNK